MHYLSTFSPPHSGHPMFAIFASLVIVGSVVFVLMNVQVISICVQYFIQSCFNSSITLQCSTTGPEGSRLPPIVSTVGPEQFVSTTGPEELGFV